MSSRRGTNKWVSGQRRHWLQQVTVTAGKHGNTF